MNTQICPICNGRCTMPNNFYNEIKNTKNNLNNVTCKSCLGRGYILLEENVVRKPTPHFYMLALSHFGHFY